MVLAEDTMTPLASELEPMTPEELKAFRAEHGLTRKQVAALLNVAEGTVRNWEQTGSGHRSMPAPSALALRRATRREIERVKQQHPMQRSTALPDRPSTESTDAG
jgi:DNA-binding transcriptional regulator YiaG